MTAKIDSKPQMVYQGNMYAPALPLRELPLDCRIMQNLKQKVESLAKETMEIREAVRKLDKEWEGWTKTGNYTNSRNLITRRCALPEKKLQRLKEICNVIRSAGFIALDAEVDLIYLGFKLDKLKV